MQCDVKADESMPADWRVAEAPPSALWNYLETIITRDEFTGGEYDEMWAKLATSEETWTKTNEAKAKATKARAVAVPPSVASATFTFQSSDTGETPANNSLLWSKEAPPSTSLTWGKEPKLLLPLLQSDSAPRLVAENSSTVAPQMLQSLG